MLQIVSIAAVLTAAAPFASAVPALLMRSTPGLTPTPSSIQANLGARLAKTSTLYFPSNPEFGEYTERYSTASEGDILMVVVPGCEEDVATTVKFANHVNLPFLAINRGHGLARALGTIRHGILIKLNKLDSIEIAADGKTATMGGGVYVDQVLAKLADSNKVCASGACGCVGMLGSGLGGGLGRYMGYFGLVSDNIVSMKVVTADGRSIKVSRSSHPDLYWAMRGAGHNFGIVTKFKQAIFDYPNGQDTYYVTYIFTEHKLESFFEQANKLLDHGNLPKEAMAYAIYAFNQDISPKPIILFQLTYFGTSAAALPYVQPFLDLGPVSVANGSSLYKNVAHEVGGVGVGDPWCASGSSKAAFPVGLKEYNIGTNRKVYNLFADMVAHEPAFAKSIVQFEGYALQGMKAINAASSAYAHRDDNILVSFTMLYLPSEVNDATAAKYGQQARQLWVDGETPRQLNVYTNYAYGDETTQQLYGHEDWRIEKLRRLKKKWDPKGKFNFYNPIV